MAKLYQVCCPKFNNKTDFYRYGKDKYGHQKYQCKKCWHQFAPETQPKRPGRPRTKEHPACPVCGKATFLHHDMEHYSNYRCCDKKCNHSILYQSLQRFQLRLCLSSLERRISSESISGLCDFYGFDHVLPGQKLVPQYRPDLAHRNEYPGIPHDHQQLVCPLCPNVPKHRFTDRSGAQFQLRYSGSVVKTKI